MKKDEPPVIVEQSFNKSIEIVWAAITEHNQMINWFFENIPSFKAQVGFSTRFNVSAQTRDFMHLWEIIELTPLHSITYDWSYQDLPGVAAVCFELFKKDAGTLLRLTNKVIESFPDDIPEFTRHSCDVGWNYFICDRLKNYLDGV